MIYDEEDIGENGHTREYNEYVPIIKGLAYSLIVILVFWIFTIV